MTTVTIPKGEYGQIRLFAVNRAIDDMTRALRDTDKQQVINDLLGVEIPENTAELFLISDLTGVGLARYLTDGYAVTQEQISRDRSRLDALDGYVLLLFSTAFDGRETTFETGPDLTLIGTYGEEQPVMAAPPLMADAALPYTGVPSMTPRAAPGGVAGKALVVLAVLVALGLLGWWLL